MGIGYQQMLDEILVLHRGGSLAHAATTLCRIVCQRLGFCIAALGDGDHTIFFGNQVFRGEILLRTHNLGASLVAVFVQQRFHLFPDHGDESGAVLEDIDIVCDLDQQLFVVVDQFFVFQPGQAMQPQLENGLRLFRRQVIFGIFQPILIGQVVGTAGIGTHRAQHRQHAVRFPGASEQFFLGLGGGRRCLDQFDNRIDIRQGNGQAFQHVTSLPRLAQQIGSAPRNDFPAMAQEGIEHFLEVKQAGLAIDQGHHVDTEHGLHLGLGIEIIEYHLAHLALAQLDDDAQAILVGFIAQLGNTLDFLVLDQFGDTFDQARLVQLVGNLRDDDALFASLLIVDDFCFGADVDPAPARAIGLHDAGLTVDYAGGGEVRTLYMLHQGIHIQIRIVQQGDSAMYHFTEIVGWYIGGHTDGDTGRTVHQQRRYPGWQDVGD